MLLFWNFLIQEVKLEEDLQRLKNYLGQHFKNELRKESEFFNFSQEEFLQLVICCGSPNRIL